MKKLIIVCIVGFGLVFLSLQMAGRAAAGDQTSENISKLLKGLELIPQAGQEQIREFILVLFDSILLTAPQVDIPKNFQSEIKGHLEEYKSTDNVIIHESGVESLWKAARFLDPDFDLDLPDEATPERIKEDIRLELHQAQSFHAQGKDNRVMEIMLRTLLRIVTPVRH